MSCAAPNCTNRFNKGSNIRGFKFPSDPKRMKQWVNNCRRDKFDPTKGCYKLCEFHFEDSQWEQRRADKWRKLKPNAVPTIFNVPNPPALIDSQPRKSAFKRERHLQEMIPNQSILVEESLGKTMFESSHLDTAVLNEGENVMEVESNPVNSLEMEEKIRILEDKCRNLEAEIEDRNKILDKILNKQQIEALHTPPRKWNNETVMKAIKYRLAMGIHGYDYLRSTGYPLPHYSTITRCVRDFPAECGVFNNILPLLRNKVKDMPEEEKFCIMSFDEMAIDGRLTANRNKRQVDGRITLGQLQQVNEELVDDPESLEVGDQDMVEIPELLNLAETEEHKCNVGKKFLAVLIRGVRSSWKQVIACHVTGSSIDGAIFKDFILECITLVESCGLRVIALSSDMGPVNRALWTALDCKILRNGQRKNSFTHNNSKIFITPDVCHLLKNIKCAMLNPKIMIILPQEYVDTHKLPSNLVSGSHIRNLWNIEMKSGKEKHSLHHLSHEMLFPDNFQKMDVKDAVMFFSLKTAAAIEFHVDLGILPREALTTAHFIRIIQLWFSLSSSKVKKTSITRNNKEGRYNFLLSIIELFHSIRFSSGWKPLNIGVIMVTLSSIDISEYLFNNLNKDQYEFLLSHRFSQDAVENIFSQVRRKAGSMPNVGQCLAAIKLIGLSQYVSDVKNNNYFTDSDNFLLDFLAEQSRNIVQQQVPLRQEISNVVDHRNMTLDTHDYNMIFMLAGRCVKVIGEKVCATCKHFCTQETEEPGEDYLVSKMYFNRLTKGGLQAPSPPIFHLIVYCEKVFCKNKNLILHSSWNGVKNWILTQKTIETPTCCDVQNLLITHFFKVRVFAMCEFDSKNRSADKRKAYGTASAKRKKIY